MRRVAQFALASAAVLVTLVAPARATELHATPVRAAATSLPRIVHGPAVPQYLPVRPSYLVDQGPSDNFPTNPYGTPLDYAQPLDYGYVDTDYYGAGVGYGGSYAFSPALRHYRHRRSHEHGVNVYRGPSASHRLTYSHAAWHGHAHQSAGHGVVQRSWMAGRSSVGGAHAGRHGPHRGLGDASGGRVHRSVHSPARPAMAAPLRRR